MHSGGAARAVGSTGHHLSDGRPAAASLRKRLRDASPHRVESRQPPGPERDSPWSYPTERGGCSLYVRVQAQRLPGHCARPRLWRNPRQVGI